MAPSSNHDVPQHQDGPTGGAAVPSGACASVCVGHTRRSVLRGAGAMTLGAAAATLLAACSRSDGTEPAAPTGSAPSGGAGTSTSGDSATGASTGLAQLADIPVGGAIGVEGAGGTPMILSQPVAGTVVGLSAICTHQGCTVLPEGTELVCPCHGSVFAAADGAVVSGPASEPLPIIEVRIEGDAVVAV